MRKLIPLFVLMTLSGALSAQTKNERALRRALDQLHTAMVAADSQQLARLVWPALSYGHSSGQIDNKAVFIQKLVSGNSDFVSIRSEDPQLIISGKTALIRFRMEAETNDRGQPGKVSLLVLLVWQKKGGNWKLLARQAVKKPG